MRQVDGLRIAFIEHEAYFGGLHTPSMFSTQQATGADVVMLLGPGKAEADLSDDYIREVLDMRADARRIVPEQGEALGGGET